MYMYFKAGSILYILSAVMLIIFVYGVYENIAIWRKGKALGHQRKLDKWLVFRTIFYEIILQLQVLKQSKIRWLVHICIFSGFWGLLMHTGMLFVLSHFIPPGSIVSRYFFLGSGRLVLDLWGDLFGSLLFLGVMLAIVRRYLFKTEQLYTIATDTISILLLLSITLTGFICEALRLASLPAAPAMAYSFLGNLLAFPLRHVQLPFLNYISVVWIHALISLAFVAYIPFGKMWHVVAGAAEILINASEEGERADIYSWTKSK